LFLGTLTGNALGLLCATIGKDPGTGNALVSMIVMPLVIFNGFFVNYDSIPPGVEYIKYISPFKYVFSVLVLNEY
jgi:ATP-binding cassette subfamily G (WHITE) protein 1